MKKLFYRIGEACKQLDIQPYVLRYWETEFPVLSPKKSKAGQRVYSEEELRLIHRIKQLLYEEGYTIAGAKKKLEAELAADTLPELQLGEPDDAGGAAGAGEAGNEARGVAGDGAPAAGRPSGTATAAVTAGADASAPPAAGPDPAAASQGLPPLFATTPATGAASASDAAPTAPPTAAPKAPAPAAANLDSPSGEQVERLRSGLRDALTQARDILRLLGD